MAYFKSAAYFVENRGRVIQYPPSVFDPSASGLFIECAKHLKMVEVPMCTFDSFREAIDTAFYNCPACKDEREAATSRFPEGAEL